MALRCSLSSLAASPSLGVAKFLCCGQSHATCLSCVQQPDTQRGTGPTVRQEQYLSVPSPPPPRHHATCNK
eukprot:4781456-Amphidinium_carterae.1